MFKLQSPSKCSPFDAIHLSRLFYHCSKQFLKASVWMPCSASAVFLFHLFLFGNTFPFEDFFHLGKQNKVCWGEIGWVGRVERGVTPFWWNTAEHSAQCGQVCSQITHHEMGKCVESSKKICQSQTQPLTATPAGALIRMGSWNTHLVGGSLYYKRPTLQKIIPGFINSPLAYEIHI